MDQIHGFYPSFEDFMHNSAVVQDDHWGNLSHKQDLKSKICIIFRTILMLTEELDLF